MKQNFNQNIYNFLAIEKELEQEIEKRKQAEEKLHIFQNLIDQSNDAVFIIESETGRFLDINTRACNNLGYKRKELLNIGVPDIEVKIPDRSSWKKHVKKRAGNTSFIMEGEHRRKDGTIFPVEVSISTMTYEQKNYRIALARDITARKKMEAALRKARDELEHRVAERTEELIRKNEELKCTQTQLIQSEKLSAIGRLAAGVAHEINSPLTPIMTYSVLMKNKFSAVPEDIRSHLPKFSKWLDVIESCSKQCKALTDKLLTFSRQTDTQMGPVYLPDVIDKTIDLVAFQLRYKSIRLVRKIDEKIPRIYGNANKLQQVLTNILINAVDASERRGKITITASCKKEICIISISDTGCGIPQKHIGKIFDPFFTTKPAGQGTGLGLSIVYGIIQEHNGEISVESELKKGTSFFIKLFPFQG